VRKLSAIRRKAYTGIRSTVGLSVCAGPGSFLQAAQLAVVLPDGFHVRAARQDEAGLLLDVMLRCWTGTVAADSSAYRETAETISQQLAHGGAAIVFEGEAAVGAGRYYPVPGPAGDPNDWVEIKRVGILKSHRKQGLGPALPPRRRRNAPHSEPAHANTDFHAQAVLGIPGFPIAGGQSRLAA
jgi:hypothetical protein